MYKTGPGKAAASSWSATGSSRSASTPELLGGDTELKLEAGVASLTFGVAWDADTIMGNNVALLVDCQMRRRHIGVCSQAVT